MRLELIVTPAQGRWRVSDDEDRLPPSWYDTVEEAVSEARDYLNHRGGGTLTVKEGSEVISSRHIGRTATARTS